MILTNRAEVGFIMGGEKRGKAWESVPPQAVICDVFCDVCDGQLVKVGLLWGSLLLLSCRNITARNSSFVFHQF